MNDGETLFLTLAVTFVGSGLGTTIVAALFKRRFDAQLETHKALLQRSGLVHARQVDALSVIYSKLEHALFYLQRVTSAGKYEGEEDNKLLQGMARELAPASEEFSKNKLLVSDDLRNKLDEFFNKMVLVGLDVRLALDPMVQGEPRVKIWTQAQQTAYKELPSILEAIRVEARAVIHG